MCVYKYECVNIYIYILGIGKYLYVYIYDCVKSYAIRFGNCNCIQ